MPGSKRQRTDLKTSIQQRQEQQRARPSSTAKTSGGGLGGQQRQGVTVQFRPSPEPLDAPKADAYWAGPPGASFAETLLSKWHAEKNQPVTPAPPLPEVRARPDAELAHLPQHGEPLTPAQEAALDLLDQLAGDLAHRITDPASVHALIDRLPDLGTGCGRAVANALREAR